MSAQVVHFEVPFDDGDRARSFYRDVFGWSINEMPEMNYTIVSTGPAGEDGMPSAPGYIGGGMGQRDGVLSQPVITIAVDDIDVAVASIAEHGGAQVGDKQTVGEMGFAAYFHDSEGNLMGLWQSA